MKREVLISITAHARAGALNRAWEIFREHRLDQVQSDPAILNVKARLLKDQAATANHRQRSRLFREAAEVYLRSAESSGRTYPLINAATLFLLGGQRARSVALARNILSSPDDDQETIYWQFATRAEAHLLLRELDKARQVLSSGFRAAPRAVEDHASTLRQLGLICEYLNLGTSWLDEFRPPRSAHFVGPISLHPDDERFASAQVDDSIRKENIGAGYGALAAGADILVAECLLNSGAELHVILPSQPQSFREKSVVKFGQRWGDRFDTLMRCATTCYVAAEESTDQLSINLASQVSMGSAVMRAEVLQTEALQLVLSPQRSENSSTSQSARFWRTTGRRQTLISVPRSGRVATPIGSPRRGSRQLLLGATVQLEFGADTPRLLENTKAIKLAFQASGTVPLLARLNEGCMTLVYPSPEAAMAGVFAAVRTLGISQSFRAAADYGTIRRIRDPFNPGSDFIAGQSAKLGSVMISSTPRSAFYATRNFAAVLHAAASRRRTELVGELPFYGTSAPFEIYSVV